MQQNYNSNSGKWGGDLEKGWKLIILITIKILCKG